jgi:hypothetical protein
MYRITMVDGVSGWVTGCTLLNQAMEPLLRRVLYNELIGEPGRRSYAVSVWEK